METILTHRCYESLLGKECISNHRIGNLLQLIFSADQITAVPINQIPIHVFQALTIRCLNGT